MRVAVLVSACQRRAAAAAAAAAAARPTEASGACQAAACNCPGIPWGREAASQGGRQPLAMNDSCTSRDASLASAARLLPALHLAVLQAALLATQLQTRRGMPSHRTDCREPLRCGTMAAARRTLMAKAAAAQRPSARRRHSTLQESRALQQAQQSGLRHKARWPPPRQHPTSQGEIPPVVQPAARPVAHHRQHPR